MFVDDEGIAYHLLDECIDTDIDYDKDANHVAILELEEDA